MNKPMWTPGPYERLGRFIAKQNADGTNRMHVEVRQERTYGVPATPESELIATARLFEHAPELVDALRALAAVAPDSPECAVALALIDRLEAPL